MRRATLSRALVLVLGLGAALTAPLGAAAAAGCPGVQGCVEVYLPGGGSPVAFTVAQIDALADVHNASYTTTIQGGTTLDDTPHVTAGLSIGALITDASPGINLHSVTFTAVPRPISGTWSTLTTPDLLPGSDFEDGLLPCVFSDGSQLHYVRPLRNSDDTNGDDSFQVAAGANLEVHVYTGPQLSVTATASTTTIKVGQSVDFGSSVSGAGAGATIRYSWTINNGVSTVPMEPSPSTSNPAHTFATAGVYEVLLKANGSDGSAGLASPIYVTVGAAPINSSTPTPGPSKSPTPHPSQPASGAPPSTSSPSAPAGRPSTGGSGAATGGATGGKAGSTPSSSNASAPAQGTSSPSPSAADPAADLPVVRGRLIGQTAALEIRSGVVVDDTAAGSAAEPSPDGWRAPAVLGWVVAIMLLFAAGMVRERRRTRRPRSVVSAQ